MPKPNKNESQDEYIKRFMSEMAEQYPDEKQRYAVAMQHWKDKENNTVDIDGVEIFEEGTWNGRKFTSNDLDGIVDTFNNTKEKMKPYLKLGHNEKQPLLDGMPAAGWITNVRRNGSKLLADLKAVPEKIKTLIDKKAYGRISSEFYKNLKLGDVTYPHTLRAVALLGADTPEVTTLNDFINLYENQNYEEIIYCENSNKEDKKCPKKKMNLTISM
jgi:lysyl-tRNA synthetase class II